jgi:hypothetical protein
VTDRTVTYSSGWGMRAVLLLAPGLMTLGVLLSLSDGTSPVAFVFNLAVLTGFWTAAVLAIRARTRVGGGRVEVRRIRTRTLVLGDVQRARREQGKGTVVQFRDGREELFPLYLPGVAGPAFVRPSGPVVEEALKSPKGARLRPGELRRATLGEFLPTTFAGFDQA